ncbi:hypothetical protein pdam_00021318 [Pocillopora damicornis]|uniref:Uncharacterized protein n=1 Tax=Pocillopora damicornis TaxID=46731 RepID=A0A3M6V3C1_POCDA|nr:hypothetical protein pdam_00021318 [Pocillopora damicornis]
MQSSPSFIVLMVDDIRSVVIQMTATKKCKDKIVDESFRAQPSSGSVPSDHPTLTPMSDQDRISPYNINIISTR